MTIVQAFTVKDFLHSKGISIEPFIEVNNSIIGIDWKDQFSEYAFRNDFKLVYFTKDLNTAREYSRIAMRNVNCLSFYKDYKDSRDFFNFTVEPISEYLDNNGYAYNYVFILENNQNY